MVNIHFLSCAWCAFIFLCAFILPDLLKTPHHIFASPPCLPQSLTKAQATSCFMESPSSHYFLIPSLSSHLRLFILLPGHFSLLLYSPARSPHVFSKTLDQNLSHLLLIQSPLQWSWVWGNKVVFNKRNGGKKRKMLACTCTVSLNHSTWLPS